MEPLYGPCGVVAELPDGNIGAGRRSGTDVLGRRAVGPHGAGGAGRRAAADGGRRAGCEPDGDGAHGGVLPQGD